MISSFRMGRENEIGVQCLAQKLKLLKDFGSLTPRDWVKCGVLDGEGGGGWGEVDSLGLHIKKDHPSRPEHF